jgi:hypothetical protein
MAMEEIGKILPKVLRPQFSRLEPPVIEVLTPLWGQVAGKALAKQSRPTAFSAGTLTLATTDPEWTVPLRQMADEIRTHVNRFLGKPVVRQVRIECIHELSRGNTVHRRLESLAVSEPGDWRRHRPTFSGAEPIGRSRVK